MKKISTIIIVAALLLGMAQCKKQETPASAGETVTITLDVSGSSSGSNGSRVIVNPETGKIDPVVGDKTIVVSGNKYVGELTYNGTKFVGPITGATEGEKLKFYFLGNLTPQYTMDGENKVGCSVVISDQTEQMPVISANESEENYTSGMTDYTSELKNKCALVKFNVTTRSTAAISIIGMNNKVTVDFSKAMNQGFTYSKDGSGLITMPAGVDNVTWAILLPQDALAAGAEGSAYSGNYSGIRPAMDPIEENQYLQTGFGLTVNTYPGYVDLGLNVSWAICNVGANSPEGYGGYFAWGETQTKDTYNWNNYAHGTENALTKYCTLSDYGLNGFTDNLTTLESGDDVATVLWGADWLMPTKDEWEELLNNTTHTMTTQGGVVGRLFTATNGNTLFLPAAGYYQHGNLDFAGIVGEYWSNLLKTDLQPVNNPDNQSNATYLYFTASGNSSCHMSYTCRCWGLPVRAVRAN